MEFSYCGVVKAGSGEVAHINRLLY